MADKILISRNPANGTELARVAATGPADVAAIVALAGKAQLAWEQTPIRERLAVVRR